MKIFALAALVGFSMFTATAAFADADDMTWVAKCVRDSADIKGADVEVVTKYCTCMNNKMSSDETLSITAWEQKHPAEMKACDKESGWR